MQSEHIKIGDVMPWIQYTGNGTQSVFDFSFPIFENEDLLVYLGVSEEPETSGYTINGAGESAGGSVTFQAPPGSGVVVTFMRNIPIRRTTDFAESGDFRAAAINTELDRLTAVAQQISMLGERSVRLADTDTAGSVQLPPASIRAGKLAGFDLAGNLIAATPNVTELIVSSFMEGVLSAANASACREYLSAQTHATVLDAITGLTPELGETLVWTGASWTSAPAVSQTQLRRLALDVAALKGGRENMVDGIVDPFSDDADIDAARSIDAFHSADGEFYRAAFLYSADRIPAMTGASTPSGVVSASSSDVGFEAFLCMDDSGPSFWRASNETTTAKLAYDFGVGNGIVARQYTVDRAEVPDGSRMPNSWAFEGSADGANWTVLDVQTGQAGWGAAEKRTYPFENAVAFRHYRLNVMAVNGGVTTEIGELEIMTGAPQDLLLTSEAFSADAQPDTALLHVQVVENEAITINTDVIARVSRDDGTTWTAAVLAQVGTLADGTVLYEATGIDISGQPAGTAMRYQIETANTKDVEIHGVVLEWS